MERGSKKKLAVALAIVAALAWLAREVQHRRVEFPGRAGWVTTDPDSLYHARRVERALREGLAVAGSDAYLDAPRGSPIPWPPYATYLDLALLAPFAPSDPERAHGWIERAVASIPLAFGVAGSLLAALAARKLAGDLAGMTAGLLHALSPVAVAYSRSGNGDHHALVSLLSGAMLYVASLAFDERALASPRRGWILGGALGALAGAALGVWVAALVYVVQLDLVLGLALFAHARRARAGLAPLGLAFHAAALAVSLPAVLASPWTERFPWMVVNLSWFHTAYLAVGGLVFVALFLVRGGSARAYPWGVAAALASLAGLLALLDLSPWRGMREGFEWVSRADQFMAGVGESRPLIGPGTGSALFDALGYGVVALPLAFAWIAWRSIRGDLRFLPWAVVLPLLALQAARQARFADALALPLAVALGAGLAALGTRLRWGSAVAGLALVLSVVSQWPCIAQCAERATSKRPALAYERPANVGVRMACEWIRAQPRRDDGESVLASWSHGHAIEWAADRPSVATNFGSYVGETGFRAAASFFMAEDPAQAAALLDSHRARFVIADSDLPASLNGLIAIGAPERRERYVTPGSERGGGVKPEWCLTMGARLMFDGEVGGPLAGAEPQLDSLRLVWIAPFVDPARTLRSRDDKSPAAWVWERVPGALVEARGAPGAALQVDLRLAFEGSRRQVAWSGRGIAAADGVARVRVPYATDAPNGEGQALGAARFVFGGRAGEIAILERAVQTGASVAVP